LIALLGGTFDPVHNGHLHAANSAAMALDVARVDLVLAARPKHRAAPIASIEDRWAMLELAVADQPRLGADDREIRRGTATYTIDTLEDARAEAGTREPIVWLLGWDAYRQLPTWHRWRELVTYAHLAVLHRPGAADALDAPMREFTEQRRVVDRASLPRAPAGSVYFIDAPMQSISSTEIRSRLARGDDVRALLPSAVSTYITNHRPYGERTS
jgi:nicotinate-nucleotide adenylyltransferase